MNNYTVNFGRRNTEITDAMGVAQDLPIDTTPSEIMIAGYVTPAIAEANGLLVVGYLADDQDCGNPLEDSEGMGRICSSHRHASREEHSAMQDALGLDEHWNRNLEHEDVAAAAKTRFREYVTLRYGDAGLVRYQLENSASGRDARFEWEALIDDYANAKWCKTDGFVKILVDDPDLPAWDGLLDDAWDRLVDEGKLGDPYAVALDCYEHGGQVWSVTGEGMQCRWDTASGAGVWVPDKCAREEADRRAKVYAFGTVRKLDLLRGPGPKWHAASDDQHLARTFTEWHRAFEALERHAAKLGDPTPAMYRQGQRRAADELAREALESYNAWLSGECYGVCVDTFIKSGDEYKLLETDACWGFIGSRYAEQEMADSVRHQAEHLKRKAA